MNIQRTAFAIGASLLVSMAVAACGNNDDDPSSDSAGEAASGYSY